MNIKFTPNHPLSNLLWRIGKILAILSSLVYITWIYNKIPLMNPSQLSASYGSLALMALINLVGLLIGWKYPKEGGIVVGTMSLMIFFYGINARNNLDLELTMWSGLIFLPTAILFFVAGLLWPTDDTTKPNSKLEEDR
jgi:hypothetical protein